MPDGRFGIHVHREHLQVQAKPTERGLIMEFPMAQQKKYFKLVRIRPPCSIKLFQKDLLVTQHSRSYGGLKQIRARTLCSPGERADQGSPWSM